MPSDEEEKVALLFRTAIPIDDIDEMKSPDLNFAVIWIDIAERPDLQVLASPEPLDEGFSICSWFYGFGNKQNTRIGLHIEMRSPVHFVLSVVFKVSQYIRQLETMSEQGMLWIVPGPPPAHLVGAIPMSNEEFISKVVAYSGQGLFVTLQDHLIVELREQLAAWKSRP